MVGCLTDGPGLGISPVRCHYVITHKIGHTQLHRNQARQVQVVLEVGQAFKRLVRKFDGPRHIFQGMEGDGGPDGGHLAQESFDFRVLVPRNLPLTTGFGVLQARFGGLVLLVNE